MTDAVAPTLTSDQLRVACLNVGVDLNCGACAALFYTGFGGYEHDASCPRREAPSLSPPASRLSPSISHPPLETDSSDMDLVRELVDAASEADDVVDVESRANPQWDENQPLPSRVLDANARIVAAAKAILDRSSTLRAELDAAKAKIAQYHDCVC
jgi:hypothetical protein